MKFKPSRWVSVPWPRREDPAIDRWSTSPLDIRSEEGVVVVGFRDGILLDAGQIGRIGTDLARLTVELSEPLLIVDFSGVQVLSSRMISVLVAVHERMQEKGARLVLCELNSQLQNILNTTRISHVLQIAGSVDDAVS